jgi:RNA polymerase sigma-70 factor (ECF subfamily)
VETFLVAFRRRGSYRLDRQDARPWLFGIASNLLRDHWRAEQRQTRAWERSAIRGEDGSDVDDVVERVDAAAAASVVGLALAALDARDREVLTLFAWADLSYDEIAEALAIPAGTVRSRLNRARRRVREILAAHDVHGGPVVGERKT